MKISEKLFHVNMAEEAKVKGLKYQMPIAPAVAKRKIGVQFPHTPEGRLLRGIFLQAVGDLFVPSQRRSAALHLQGYMFEAEVCGIDSSWIRELFKKAGVSLKE